MPGQTSRPPNSRHQEPKGTSITPPRRPAWTYSPRLSVGRLLGQLHSSVGRFGKPWTWRALLPGLVDELTPASPHDGGDGNVARLIHQGGRSFRVGQANLGQELQLAAVVDANCERGWSPACHPMTKSSRKSAPRAKDQGKLGQRRGPLCGFGHAHHCRTQPRHLLAAKGAVECRSSAREEEACYGAGGGH